MKKLTEQNLFEFEDYLRREEKSPATIEKYMRDIRTFFRYAKDQPVTKELVIGFKKNLCEKNLAVSSINSMLASVNSLFRYMRWEDCKTSNLRQQRQIYCPEEKELTKKEYLQLLEAAKERPWMHLLMQTICGTGIRVSELRYFTVEAVKQGTIIIFCKKKMRTILVPRKLRKLLLTFAKKRKIKAGAIFVTVNGNPLDRHRIWSEMKKLCKKANVQSSKVFPHNLRKLFAKTFYSMEKDIAKLADILGHSNINTTRIYIMSSGTEHLRKLERLNLVIGAASIT